MNKWIMQVMGKAYVNVHQNVALWYSYIFIKLYFIPPFNHIYAFKTPILLTMTWQLTSKYTNIVKTTVIRMCIVAKLFRTAEVIFLLLGACNKRSLVYGVIQVPLYRIHVIAITIVVFQRHLAGSHYLNRVCVHWSPNWIVSEVSFRNLYREQWYWKY